MTNQKEGTIIKISGALIEAKNMSSATMYELVKVSNENLIGEIIKIEGDIASIQVYEETTGISPGEPVYRTGSQLAVNLGPGLLGEIYDGIQRPLRGVAKKTGDFITRGVDVPALSLEKEWHFKPLVKSGDVVEAGDIIGEVQETEILSHKIMVPPNAKKGSVRSIKEGAVSLKDFVATIKTDDGKEVEVFMSQKWPIRKPRPIKEKNLPSKPLITGQRIVDSFFPIAKGGAACIPGPFGAGKTVTLSQFAKWSDADIIIHIGCGERGNEMTDALIELQELVDPKTKKPLLERTVIIANTSNMPVAAREASIYTGITIAEYFRDMGYDVALMADSTSRWAEALREMSARLEEMPGEEGYPAYLGSRVASFYERAGYVKCLGSGDRSGSLTVIGSVSPPGGDLSEPVTQNTLRVNKVFWGLEDKLANARHFPAINWLSSYSMYLEDVVEYYKENAGSDFMEIRDELMRILSEEAKLEEIVRLVGYEALSSRDKLTLETAKIIREDFLQQDAFDEVDAYTSLKKQYWMLSRIINFYRNGMKLLEEEKTIKEIMDSSEYKGLIGMKFEELSEN